MTTPAAPLALAMGLLVLSAVVAIGLIPVLDVELRRANARRAAAEEAAANDNDRAARDARRGGGVPEMSADPHTLTRAQVIALLEERDTLREQVRQLEEALVPAVVLPRAWRLSTTEEAILLAIRAVGPNVCHRERLMLALYGMWDEAPEQKILDALVCHVRRKLMEAQARIEIETVWGRGYRLTAEGCARFDEAVRADRAAWGGGELSKHPTAAPAAAAAASRPRTSWRDRIRYGRRFG